MCVRAVTVQLNVVDDALRRVQLVDDDTPEGRRRLVRLCEALDPRSRICEDDVSRRQVHVCVVFVLRAACCLACCCDTQRAAPPGCQVAVQAKKPPPPAPSAHAQPQLWWHVHITPQCHTLCILAPSLRRLLHVSTLQLPRVSSASSSAAFTLSATLSHRGLTSLSLSLGLLLVVYVTQQISLRLSLLPTASSNDASHTSND